MNIKSLPLVIMIHGIATKAFVLSFFLEAYGIHLPLLSIKAQHPSVMNISIFLLCMDLPHRG